ncbi:hypothetical protein BAZOLSSOX_1533 [uncultured Gammaproteobacteria bacterium]|nr:hypothetical protein BAZOLSSOX_1533 [uncultured Gammaproteobacteria bacterium]
MPQLSALSPWSQKMRNIHDNTKKLMTDISNKVVVIVRKLIDKSKENTTFTYTILTVTVVFILDVLNLIDTETKITYTSIGSGLIAIIGLHLFYQRLKNQEKQIDIQINQRIDERFNSAINLLGSSETSARTGAIYALHELAREEEKYRKQIAQILCSHIRSKTNEEEYQQKHNKRPSNEIQTTINLLFKEHEHGLYTQDFARVAEFPKADLSHAYLMGANFERAQCQGASFYASKCQEADFWDAHCQGANFEEAQCQGADFWETQCQGADFSKTQLQGACTIDARHISLENRIGKNTELNITFKGRIDENTIKIIENSKSYLSDFWYQNMQKIIRDNEGLNPNYHVPNGCITGILEDSEEIQAIINKDWDKLKQLQNVE